LLAQLLRIDAVHVVKSSSSNQVGDHTCFDWEKRIQFFHE
jgi:hypothetical protein